MSTAGLEVTDRPADLIPCRRCPRKAMLCPAGLCADCVADIGLHHADEHAAWRAEVRRVYVGQS